MALSKQSESLLYVGNPGAGKSTLANASAEQLLFKSGMSFGGGLTSELDIKIGKDGKTYMDTPGLACATLREKAAKAISKALQTGGLFKIIFVVLQVSGRVRADDLTTVELVLQSCPEIQEGQYGIVVNQCSERFMAGILESAKYEQFQTVFFKSICRKTNVMIFLPENAILKDKDNALVPMDDLKGFSNFLLKCPNVTLTPHAAKDINANSFTDMQKIVEEKDNEMHKLKKDADEGKQEAKEKFDKMVAENNAKMEELKKQNSFCFFKDVLLPVLTLGVSKVIESVAKKPRSS